MLAVCSQAGGGLILVPIYVYLLNLNERDARANSLFCILPMVIVTALLYSKENLINWMIGIKCAIGGIIGGIIGGRLLNTVSIKFLKIFFIILLFYAGFNMILK